MPDSKFIRFEFVKKISMPHPLETLDISSETARAVPDLSKALTILSDTTVRRSTVDGEDLTSYWKSEKKATFLEVFSKLINYKFFKDFTNHRKKANWTVVFSHRPLPNILKYRDHRFDLPITIWKTRFLQTHMEEFS